MNPKQLRWANRALSFIFVLSFLIACSKPNTPPELSRLVPLSPLIFVANSHDLTPDKLELGFSIADAEDKPEALVVTAEASDSERIRDIDISCEQDKCLLSAEVNRQRPATVSIKLNLLDSAGASANSSFNVKIEPSYLASASLEALQDAVSKAAVGAFIALSANLFPQASSWSLTKEWFITKDITIQGPGTELLSLDAQNLSRHFRIAKNVRVGLEAITLKHGFAQNDGGQGDAEPLGGAIFNQGKLELRGIHIHSSKAVKGGAIYNFGADASLLLIDSLLGGDDASFANHASRSGGAIFNDLGRLELVNSQLSFNTSDERGGAVYNLGTSAFMLADKSLFLNNISADGGAIKNEDGRLRIQNQSVLKDNIATLVEGGAIFNTNSKVEILDSSLIANSALKGAGGGMYSFGPKANVIIQRSRVEDNFALSGGGIYHEVQSGPLTISASVISANRANSFGGGVFTGGLTSLSADTLVVNNVADADGDSTGYGGGVFVVHSDISGIATAGIKNNSPDDVAEPIPEDSSLFAALGAKFIKTPGNR